MKKTAVILIRNVVVLIWILDMQICPSESKISPLDVTITPGKVHVQPGEDATFVCKANAPITHCQVIVLDHTPAVLDLSLGPRSKLPSGYEYQGNGLEAGECGIKLSSRIFTFPDQTAGTFSCRVRNADSDWTYGFMAVYKNSADKIPLTTDSRLVVAKFGSKLDVLFKAEVPLTSCALFHAGLGGFLDLSENDRSCGDRNFCYIGKGLAQKECGAVIRNVTDDFGGITWFFMSAESGKRVEHDLILVIVAKPPDTPVLFTKTTTNDDGSLTLQATCTVSGSRPAANVSWYFGGERISNDDLEYITYDAWIRQDDLQTVKQKYTKRLSASDDGKELWCLAEHVALRRGKRSEKVKIFSKPRRPDTPAGDKECPPLTSDSVDISCSLAGEDADCAQPQPTGTVAHLSCKSGHVIPPNVIYRRVTCLRSAKWDRPIFSCNPDCGRRNTNGGTLLISGGEDAKVGEFPWHVGVYQNTGSNGTFQQICGGTLVTPTIVVSAAHCFWDTSLRKKVRATMFKVAAGKTLRVLEDPDPSVQTNDVTEIIVPALYKGRVSNFASDIAILHLATPFKITTTVNIICVDWDNLHELRQLRAGNAGIVTGWGFTEDGSQSDVLKYVKLPYVPSETCFAALPESVQPILTHDKICAGYANKNTSVCGGDSGGGLVFLDTRSDKYYLRAVVSVSFRPADFTGVCYAELYTGFTLVSSFISWIQQSV